MSTFTSSNWAQNVLQDPGHAASRTGLPDMILPSECSLVSGRSTDTATDARPHGSPIAVLLRPPAPLPATTRSARATQRNGPHLLTGRIRIARSLALPDVRTEHRRSLGRGDPERSPPHPHPPIRRPSSHACMDQSYTANRTRSRWYLPDRTLVCRCGLTVHDA